MLNPTPRVILVPGLGCIAVGPDARTARVAAEVAYRSHSVTAQVLDVFGEVTWLKEEEIFDIDYWPLELAKLQSAPAPPPLGGHIILVGGVESDLARGLVEHLAKLGAHLVLADANEHAIEAAAEHLPREKCATAAVGLGDEAGVRVAVGQAVDTFGGLDAVVTFGNADVPSLQAAMRRAFYLQDIEGSLVLVGEAMAPEQRSDVRTNAVEHDPEAPADEIAAAVTYLISDSATHVTGCVIPVRSRVEARVSVGSGASSE